MLIKVSETSISGSMLPDVKRHLPIIGGQDDTRLIDLIDSAVDTLQRSTGRTLMATVWKEVLDSFPTRLSPLWFPYYSLYRPWFTASVNWHRDTWFLSEYPVSSITNITYFDGMNSSLTLVPTTDFYSVLGTNHRAIIQPVSSWPATFDRPDAVTVNYTTSDLPPVAKHWLRLRIGAWNENRSMLEQEFLEGSDRLLDLLNVRGYA